MQFEYSLRHVNHRIFTGGLVAFLGIVVVLAFSEGAPLFRALLAVGVAVSLLYVLRFTRLSKGDGVALILSDDGLEVEAWGVGTVPWRDIHAARIAARSTIQVVLEDPDRWLDRLSVRERLLRRVEALLGAGPFTIDGGVLTVQPVEVLAAIQARLTRS